jgi:hypothetical protein
MKFIPSQMMKVAAVCALSGMALSALATPAAPVRSQYSGQSKDQGIDKSKQSAPSDGEVKALEKVKSSPDVASKLVAAGEFVKKYPKSTLRSNVVGDVAKEANRIQDGTQRITQLESMLTVFKESSDADVINPILVDAYFKASRDDDGFRVAAGYLAKNPNDLAVLTQITTEGVEQAKKNNAKFVPPSRQYGGKAIEIIESGKKPDTFDDARWSQYQTKWLPMLYQWTGLLAMVAGSNDEAKSRLEKAKSLDASDPFNYYLLGSIVNDEYQKIAQEYQTLTAGPLKDTKRQLAETKLDEVVDIWAHTVALSDGNAQYQQLHDAVLQDIQAYYKYRHKGSTDGLQQLIDKYKK